MAEALTSARAGLRTFFIRRFGICFANTFLEGPPSSLTLCELNPAEGGKVVTTTNEPQEPHQGIFTFSKETHYFNFIRPGQEVAGTHHTTRCKTTHFPFPV